MNTKETLKRNTAETTDNSSKKQKIDSSSTNTSKQKSFQYGNYNRYYGYRNANKEKDKRIDVFQRQWFEGKTCLDIGCNVGHLTLWIAKYFKARKMKGVDIDCNLIHAAKNNITHYVGDDGVDENCKSSPEDKVDNERTNNCEKAGENLDTDNTEDSKDDGQCTNSQGVKVENAKSQNENIANTHDTNKGQEGNSIKSTNYGDVEFPDNVTFVTVSACS